MTVLNEPSREGLLACPFCSESLWISSRKINPKAYCRTEDCFGRKMPVVNLDDPLDVTAWNTRATSSKATEPSREDNELLAKIIYDAFPFNGDTVHKTKPEWVLLGNSIMQDKARQALGAILARLAAKPAEDGQLDPRTLEACARHVETTGLRNHDNIARDIRALQAKPAEDVKEIAPQKVCLYSDGCPMDGPICHLCEHVQSPPAEDVRGRTDNFLQGVRDALIEKCAKIAEAIDSGRGNEKQIAKAIRALQSQGDASDQSQTSHDAKAVISDGSKYPDIEMQGRLPRDGSSIPDWEQDKAETSRIMPKTTRAIRLGICQLCQETTELKCGPSRFGPETWACANCWESGSPISPAQCQTGDPRS